jgi:cell wall-associated NlpC family hydrolase
MSRAAPDDDQPKPDRRRNAWRDDLAAEELWDRILVPNYAPGWPRQLLRPSVPMRSRPDKNLPFDNEIVFGETLKVYDEADGWAWVQLERDRYVGYVPADGLAAEIASPTHRIQALGTFIYPRADIKSPPIMPLTCGSLVAVSRGDDKFCELKTGGFVVTRHLAETTKPARDWVEVAERFLGVPYLWGGRTRLGVDCSGLVQIAMQAGGLDCPRDSDMQQDEIGTSILIPNDLEGLQRGDLVFWKGHVGIMTDGVMMIHANAHHMAVAIEPLVVAARRISRTGSEVVAVRRPAGPAGEA